MTATAKTVIDAIHSLDEQGYRYGFVTDIEAETAPQENRRHAYPQARQIVTERAAVRIAIVRRGNAELRGCDVPLRASWRA